MGACGRRAPPALPVAALTPGDRLRALLAELGLDLDPGLATITGADPVLPSRYPLGEAAAAVMAAIGLVSGRLWELRGNPPQAVSADVRHCAALLRGFLDQVVDDEVLDPDPTSKLEAIGLFEAADGHWVQTYGVFSPLLERTLDVLGCDPNRASMAAAVAGWPAEDLVEALNAAGAPGAVVRTGREWEDHPQGIALRALALIEIERIGDAPAEPLPPGASPLAGVRVLDTSRIVAGPACGRTLAEHGAEVLAVGSGQMPSIHRALVDTSPGKLSAQLDLDDPGDRQTLDELIGEADVFCQSARPGSFHRRGLGPEVLARHRPGIVYASTDCYGHTGPWRERAGFEPLAQASTGWASDHREEGRPAIVAALACDYATGFLTALGVMWALKRRMGEGGSWHVRTSLCRTAMWLRDQPGRYDADAARVFTADSAADLRIRTETGFGVVDQLGPGVTMADTPPGWPRPAMPPGTHPPRFS